MRLIVTRLENIETQLKKQNKTRSSLEIETADTPLLGSHNN